MITTPQSPRLSGGGFGKKRWFQPALQAETIFFLASLPGVSEEPGGHSDRKFNPDINLGIELVSIL